MRLAPALPAPARCQNYMRLAPANQYSYVPKNQRHCLITNRQTEFYVQKNRQRTIVT
jgi:hypothetical protein